ncbi:hypothetical protein HOP38_02715 [Vibrio mediterranei]|uniref:hypothetical protein n=1 Tax=Vibrio mediterranei TaxID=689 RepID=UPI0017DCD10C|nr:hypothetical protein [Vibrio mediterranei]NUW71423.1 hypothetical protein [Vibrio mediterranei]
MDKREIYIFEPIARLIEQPEDHDFQLQEALERISLSLGGISSELGDDKNGIIKKVNDINVTLYKLSATKPDAPTDADLHEWSKNPPEATASERVWAVTGPAQSSQQPIPSWSNPVPWSGQNGVGADGDDGNRWAYKEDWNSRTPTTAELNAWFSSLVGRQKKNGDVIYLRNHTTDPIDVKAYFVLNSAWTPYQKVIDGDMLVDGGILGRHISSQTTIKAGSGSGAVIINGDHSSAAGALKDYVFVVGDDDPTNAVLWMKDDGSARFNGEVEVGKLIGSVGMNAKQFQPIPYSEWVFPANDTSSKRQRLIEITVPNENFRRTMVVTLDISGFTCDSPSDIYGVTVDSVKDWTSLKVIPSNLVWTPTSTPWRLPQYENILSVEPGAQINVRRIAYNDVNKQNFLGDIRLIWNVILEASSSGGDQVVYLGASMSNPTAHGQEMRFRAIRSFATVIMNKFEQDIALSYPH